MIILINRKKEKISLTNDINTNTEILLKNVQLEEQLQTVKNSYIASYHEMHRTLIHEGQISNSSEPNASALTNKAFF